jgi:hypothetical protein
MVERRGVEPLTFRLPACAPNADSPGETARGPRLSSGLSSNPARDSVALAQELLAQAERASNPAPLIAAARALLAEAAGERPETPKSGDAAGIAG